MQQAQDILVETIDSNGSLRFAVSSDIEAPVTKRIPIEAQFLDTDGIWIHALLHVVHGRLTELEIYKDDSSNVIKAPNAADWEILLLG
ncbi:MAG: hypothetical protein HY288_07410 [Planctomycetia bacterium]|nr:hypothetical protein [Planctomycetia bacterium]